MYITKVVFLTDSAQPQVLFLGQFRFVSYFNMFYFLSFLVTFTYFFVTFRTSLIEVLVLHEQSFV